MNITKYIFFVGGNRVLAIMIYDPVLLLQNGLYLWSNLVVFDQHSIGHVDHLVRRVVSSWTRVRVLHNWSNIELALYYIYCVFTTFSLCFYCVFTPFYSVFNTFSLDFFLRFHCVFPRFHRVFLRSSNTLY